MFAKEVACAIGYRYLASAWLDLDASFQPLYV